MENQLDPVELRENLSRFSGTENIYWEPAGDFLYTDGIKYMAEHCGAYWLLTDGGTRSKALMERSPFVKIVITCDEEMAMVEYTDGNGGVLHESRYLCPNFPLQVFTMYFTGNTLLLPGEY